MKKFSWFRKKRIKQLKKYIEIIKTYPEYPNEYLEKVITIINWIIASEEYRTCHSPKELLHIMLSKNTNDIKFVQMLYMYVHHKSFAGII